MTMLPVLPVIAGESLTSYLNRAARFHSNMDVYRFLSYIEFSQVASMAPTQENLERLEHLFGLPFAQLEKMTFRPLGERMRSICGEVVHSEFANLDQTSFCPACLLEDGELDSPSRGIRVGRIEWRIEPIRTCEKHGIGLIRRKNNSYSERFQLMEAVAPSNSELAQMVKDAPRQKLFDLQRYVSSRLRGEKGPRWLDGQPIDLAARACELLGVILTKGTHIELRQVSGAEWSAAGQVGFDFAARGEAGIRDGLQFAFQRFEDANMRGGPQKVFGRLYQWMQFRTYAKQAGPIRDVMREFILDRFPIEEGTDLFGEPVDRQRVHTVRTLARKTGWHEKTIQRFLVSAGVIIGDPARSASSVVFDLETGEKIMSRVANSLNLKELREFLNCNRMQAEILTREGVIRRAVEDGGIAGFLSKSVTREDAQEFLDNLLRCAKQVETAGAHTVDITTAATLSRWPVVDIVKGILCNRFDTVHIVDKSLKFHGILLDPMEVRMSLCRSMVDDHVGVDEAAQFLKLPSRVLPILEKLKRMDGEPYTCIKYVGNSKGVQVALYSTHDLKQFLAENMSLREIALKFGTSAKNMKSFLEKWGCEPIAERKLLNGYWFRRHLVEELPAERLGHKRLPNTRRTEVVHLD